MTRPLTPSSPPLPVDWRRLRTPWVGISLVILVVGAMGQAWGTVLAGRLAEAPGADLLGWLALSLVGGVALDALGRVVWVGEVDRAEGALRRDVLRAAVDQPVPALADQAVGELLDRIDDDSYEIGSLCRLIVWRVMGTLATAVPMWVIAGLTWWPAWFLFPVVAALTLVAILPLFPRIAERKVLEEAAFTDHAAALEEAIAARDDVRTSLGQPYVVRRLAELSAVVHRRFKAVLDLEIAVVVRSGLILQGLVVVLVVAGAWLVQGGQLGLGALVTLFLVSSRFVGVMAQLAEQLPELQAGMGAVIRLRQMLALEPEPSGGEPLPEGPLGLEFRELDFAYEEGSFALRGVDLEVPAGQTLALVGRTGSGKTTLASMVSRAVEPPSGSLLVGGADARSLDLAALRESVGTVTQRTEVLAGTLEENITLFADLPHEQVVDVVAELGLQDWVAGLPEGLDTRLGPGGVTLSAGEEQLLAFARLLARDVRIVVLDEATARMDPLTESRVVRASERLLSGRTGVLVAHRLSTIERADLVAVLDAGRVVQFGTHAQLSRSPGRFSDLLTAAGRHEPGRAGAVESATPAPGAPGAAAPTVEPEVDHPMSALGIGTARRMGEVPPDRSAGSGISLTRGVLRALAVRPDWGLLAVPVFLLLSVTGAVGAGTAFAWGRMVESLGAGESPWWWVVAVVVLLLSAPPLLAFAISRYPRWWVEVLFRVRMAVMVGQTSQRRLPGDPPGEVVARAMDAERYVRYADRWVDFTNGMLIAVFTAVISGHPTTGLVLAGVLVAAGLVSAVGRPWAGRSAARASQLRADFGRSVVSALESVRTVKLAGRMPQVTRHLLDVDHGRVRAAVMEHRVQASLDGIPMVLLQAGAVGAWWAHQRGWWDLATTLLVASTVMGFAWFGQVAGAIITEAPGTRAWQVATNRMAGGRDLTLLPEGVDLVAGTAPAPAPVVGERLETLELRGVGVSHDDGTIGVEGVDLQVRRGELVLLLGQVGSGKSSLLRGLAGLEHHTGEIRWNGRRVEDPDRFLRPGQVAWVAQVPRVLSGTYADNIRLGHERAVDAAIDISRMQPDIEAAGGVDAVIGHRGVRLSGGQVQRLALARALAAGAELVLADDVSSALDARTELELWGALQERGSTVVGASSKRAALARADRVVVLVAGRVVAVGPWERLQGDWGHLAG
ncbi:ATP-binding cassette domain-containing protein [Kytococcus sedentarius]|uniref:ATP-binding cassette domain-containing protein n=1 Tax=Kytococcus sedentarius TaxID=1276 RepID=UPI0035BC0A21